MKFQTISILLTTLLNAQTASADGDLCHGACSTAGGEKSCVFTASLNLSAGELGYYVFEECGSEANPTLGVEKGVTYRFVQSDESNYYHPLGLAYYPDGAHDDVDELEPGIAPPGSTSDCADSNMCPAPMYLRGGEYLGQYSNNAGIAPLTGSEDFGLDFYEPEFFLDPVTWNSAGTYEVALKFDVDDFTDDIFYFCHIHQFMTGRIKFVDSAGVELSPVDSPAIAYEYDMPSAYDQTCGTYGLGDFQLPHPECPEQFVCDKPDGVVGQFAGCLDSMNCAMTAGMTTNVNQGSAAALFLHQMIPHHQNAVNMCKALFHTKELKCDDVTDEDDPHCVLTALCYEIINVQNFQIQNMRGVIDALGYDAEDDCKVHVTTPLMTKAPKATKAPKQPKESKTKAPKRH